MKPLFRFHRFSSRVLALLLGLLFAVLGATYLSISHANLSNALAHSEANLDVGERIYHDAVHQQIDFLARGASVMAGDYAIRTVLQAEHPDPSTLSSALQSYTSRVGAPVIAYFDADRNQIHQVLAVRNDGAGRSEMPRRPDWEPPR